MRKLQCQSCGAVLDWDGITDIITCSACGMRYQMYQRTSEERMRAAALQTDCFAERPVLSGTDTGQVWYSSWLPKGWSYEIGCDPNFFRYGASVATPFVPYILIFSPDRTSHMKHYTSNGYMDPGNAPLAFSTPAGDVMLVGKGGVGGAVSNDPSSLGVPSYIRWRSLTSASAYCDEIAVLDGYCSNLSLMDEQTEMDEVVLGRIEQVKKSVPDVVAQHLWWDWRRKLYRAFHGNVPYVVVAEAQIATSGFNVEDAALAAERQQRRQERVGTGLVGIFGAVAEGLSQMSQPQSGLPRWWQTDYEAVFTCPSDLFEELYPEYLKFISTLELGRDFKAQQDMVAAVIAQASAQAQGTVNHAMAQMAADRAASMQRRNDIIRETNDYTTSVMHDMMASNSASMDRVRNMTSEAIGGYNVYQGADGNLVRADVAFDHVYQGTGQYSDTLVGVEGGWLEAGVDFVPLDQIKGGEY